MKPTPPSHIILPVLTERLPTAEPSDENVSAEPFQVQPSAYAQAVYRGAEQVTATAPVVLLPEERSLVAAPPIDVDALWQELAPVLQQQVRAMVDAELAALAPQLAARLLESLETSLRAGVAGALQPR